MSAPINSFGARVFQPATILGLIFIFTTTSVHADPLEAFRTGEGDAADAIQQLVDQTSGLIDLPPGDVDGRSGAVGHHPQAQDSGQRQRQRQINPPAISRFHA